MKFVTCNNRPASDCTVVRGTGQTLLLMGDSHAAMLMPALIEVAKQDNLTLDVTTTALCPWQQNLYAPDADFADLIQQFGLSPKYCKVVKKDLYTRLLPALHPDIIIAMEQGDANVYPNPEQATIQSLAQLDRDGRQVVLVEDTPTDPFDPLSCLSQAKVLEECRYVTDTTPTPLEVLYRRLDAENSGVFSANFDQLVCPYLPICDPVVNGKIVKTDASHLTGDFSRSIAPQINAYLKQTVIKTGPWRATSGPAQRQSVARGSGRCPTIRRGARPRPRARPTRRFRGSSGRPGARSPTPNPTWRPWQAPRQHRGATVGAAQAGRDPTGGAERGHEIPEDREPRGRDAREVATGRDQRVDERVTAQSAPVTLTDPMHERRPDERGATDRQHCVGDDPPPGPGHGTDVAVPTVEVGVGPVVAVTEPDDPLPTEPLDGAEPEVEAAAGPANVFAVSADMHVRLESNDPSGQIVIGLASGHRNWLPLIVHPETVPPVSGVADTVGVVTPIDPDDEQDVTSPARVQTSLVAPPELIPLSGVINPFGAFFASQSVNVPPLETKPEMTNR